MAKLRLFFILVLTIIVFTSVLLYTNGFNFFSKNVLPSAAPESNATHVTAIKAQISDLGPEQAYQAIVTTTKSDTTVDPHMMGHYYGQAVSELAVDPALVLLICRTELFSGCLHQFIGHLLHTYGVDYIQELERLCLSESSFKLYNECLHGLGHGLLAHQGYREADLYAVIKYCDDVFLGEIKSACQGGVFMEFNTRDFIDEPPRILTDDDPYFPCVNLGKYTASCVYYLPLLWKGALQNTSGQNLMDLCHNFPGSDSEKVSCYEGVGRTISATSTEDVAFTASQCDEIGQFSEDASLACRWTAVRDHSLASEDIDTKADTRCINLTGEKLATCIKYMQVKIDFLNDATHRLHEERKKVYDL